MSPAYLLLSNNIRNSIYLHPRIHEYRIIRTTQHFDSFGITGRIIVFFINGERQTTWSKISINLTLTVVHHYWE